MQRKVLCSGKTENELVFEISMYSSVENNFVFMLSCILELLVENGNIIYISDCYLFQEENQIPTRTAITRPRNTRVGLE